VSLPACDRRAPRQRGRRHETAAALRRPGARGRDGPVVPVRRREDGRRVE